MSGYTAEQWTAAGFNAVYYKANNADVVDIYGTTTEALLAHYIRHGNDEGRAFSVEMKTWQDSEEGKAYDNYIVDKPALIGSTPGEVYIHYKTGVSADIYADAVAKANKDERDANAKAAADAQDTANTAKSSAAQAISDAATNALDISGNKVNIATNAKAADAAKDAAEANAEDISGNKVKIAANAEAVVANAAAAKAAKDAAIANATDIEANAKAVKAAQAAAVANAAAAKAANDAAIANAGDIATNAKAAADARGLNAAAAKAASEAAAANTLNITLNAKAAQAAKDAAIANATAVETAQAAADVAQAAAEAAQSDADANTTAIAANATAIAANATAAAAARGQNTTAASNAQAAADAAQSAADVAKSAADAAQSVADAAKSASEANAAVLAGKQATLSDSNKLSQALVEGLESSLAGKQSTISDSNQIAQSNVNGLLGALAGKQSTISDSNQIAQSNVAGLAAALTNATKGDTGAPGKDGTNGKDGKDGAPGEDGADGATSEKALMLNDLKDGTSLNYTGLDLSDVDFEANGFTLPAAAGTHVLRNCTFDGNNSAKALLTQGYTGSLDLTGSTFVGCDLGVDSPGTATAVDADVNLKGCSFERAILNGVNFSNMNTAGETPSNFKGAQLQKTYNDDGTTLRAACQLPGAALDHADFSESTDADGVVHKANLCEVVLAAATTIQYANFTNAILAVRGGDENEARRQFSMNSLGGADVEGAIFRSNPVVKHNFPIMPNGSNATNTDYTYRFDNINDASGNAIAAVVGPRLSSKDIDFSNREGGIIKFSNEVLDPSYLKTFSGATLAKTTDGTPGTISFKVDATGGSGSGAKVTLTIAAAGTVTVSRAAASDGGTGYTDNDTLTLFADGTSPFVGISGDITCDVAGESSGVAQGFDGLSANLDTSARVLQINGIAFNTASKGKYDLTIQGGAAAASKLIVKGNSSATTDLVDTNTVLATEFTAAKIQDAINALANISASSVTLTAAPVLGGLDEDTDLSQDSTFTIPELENTQYVNLGGAKFTAKARVSGTNVAKAYTDITLTNTASGSTNYIVPTMSNAAQVLNKDKARAEGKTDAELKELDNADGEAYEANSWAAWKWRARHTVTPADDASDMLVDAADTTLTCAAATGNAVEEGEYMLLAGVELVKVVTKTSPTALIVERGQGGTTAAARDGSSGTAITVVIYKLTANRHENVPFNSGKNAAGNVVWEADYGDLYLPPFVSEDMYRGFATSGVATISASGAVFKLTVLKNASDEAAGKNRIKGTISQKTYANHGLVGKSFNLDTGAAYPVGMSALSVFDRESLYGVDMLVGPDMDLTHLSNFYGTVPAAGVAATVDNWKIDFGNIFSLDGCDLSELYLDIDGVKSLNNVDLSDAYLETSMNPNYAENLNVSGTSFRTQVGSGLIWRVNFYAKGIRGDIERFTPYNGSINHLYTPVTSSGASTSCVYGPGIDLSGCTIPSNIGTISSSLEDSSFIGVTTPVTANITLTGSLKNAVVSSISKPTTFSGLFKPEGDISGADFSGMIANVDTVDASKLFDASAATAVSAVPRPIFKNAQIKGCKLFECSLAGALAVVGDNGTNKDALRMDFTGADLTGAELNKANFKGADFENATLTNLHIKLACDLTNSSFKGANCTNMKAQSVPVTQTAATGEQVVATLVAADFSGATITGMQIKKSVAETHLTAANFKNVVTGSDTISDMTANFDDGFKILQATKVNGVTGNKLQVMPNQANADLDLSDYELVMDIPSDLNFGISNLAGFVLKDSNMVGSITTHLSNQADHMKGFDLKNMTINASQSFGFNATVSDANLATLFGTKDLVAGADNRSNAAITAEQQLPELEGGRYFKLFGLSNGGYAQKKDDITGSMYNGNYGVPADIDFNNKEIRDLEFRFADLSDVEFRGAKYSSVETELSVTQNVAAAGGTSATLTLAAAPTRPFVVGDQVAVSGHTGNAANLAMNQVFTVTSVTSSTVYVLSGSGMTAATYNTGVIIAKHANPIRECILPANYKLFSGADNSQYVFGPGVVINYAADLDQANLDGYVLGDATSGMKFGDGIHVVDFDTDGSGSPSFIDTDLTNVDFGISKLGHDNGAIINFRGATLNGTDFENIAKDEGQFKGIQLTTNSSTKMPTATTTVGEFDMSILGTVDGEKKFKATKKLA